MQKKKRLSLLIRVMVSIYKADTTVQKKDKLLHIIETKKGVGPLLTPLQVKYCTNKIQVGIGLEFKFYFV